MVTSMQDLSGGMTCLQGVLAGVIELASVQSVTSTLKVRAQVIQVGHYH